MSSAVWRPWALISTDLGHPPPAVSCQEVGSKKSLPIIKVEVGPIEWAGGGSGTTLCRSPKPCSHAEPADTIVLEPFGRVPGKV